MSCNNLSFADLEEEEKKIIWWNQELEECHSCYKIPSYNLPYPVSFKRKPKICVDIGANVGTFSFYASGCFEKVFAYEAIKNTYKEAKKNLAEKENVTLYNLAVSDNCGENIKLWAHNSNLSGDSSIYNKNKNKNYEICKTINLEKIFDNNNIDYIDYLKIDCEGSEYNFLMNKDLSKINFLVMEIHPGYLGEQKTYELNDYLKKFFDLAFYVGDHILFFIQKGAR